MVIYTSLKSESKTLKTPAPFWGVGGNEN